MIEVTTIDLFQHSADTHHFLSTPQKNLEPSFIMEIIDDEEEFKAKIQLSPIMKKFKLFSSSILSSETNNHGNPKSLNYSFGEHSTEPLECSMNDIAKENTSTVIIHIGI